MIEEVAFQGRAKSSHTITSFNPHTSIKKVGIMILASKEENGSEVKELN